MVYHHGNCVDCHERTDAQYMTKFPDGYCCQMCTLARQEKEVMHVEVPQEARNRGSEAIES